MASGLQVQVKSRSFTIPLYRRAQLDEVGLSLLDAANKSEWHNLTRPLQRRSLLRLARHPGFQRLPLRVFLIDKRAFQRKGVSAYVELVAGCAASDCLLEEPVQQTGSPLRIRVAGQLPKKLATNLRISIRRMNV